MANWNKIFAAAMALLFIFLHSISPVFASEPAKRASEKVNQPRLMLGGAVIRYDKLSQELTREQWQHILANLSEIGIKTIVVQHHHFVPHHAEGRFAEELDFLPQARAEPGKINASEIILDYADSHDMSVYMGLWMDLDWYSNLDVMDQLAHNLNRAKTDLKQLEEELTGKKGETERSAAEIKTAEAEIAVCKKGLETVSQELEEKSQFFKPDKDGALAGPTVKMADALVRQYGHHKSFVGWYFPEEIWDAAFTSESIAVINPLLRFITDHCREISGPVSRPFAMSPYASQLHYDTAAEIEAAQSELFKNSGVNILMLQDSIGDLNLKEDEDIAVRLRKHFTAFSKVAAALDMQLWAEVESFERVGAVRRPTNIGRFKKQIQYSYQYLNRNEPVFVVYDYLHFFSLLGPNYPYPEMRAKLYDDYKREFVDSQFVPPAEKTP